MSTGDLMLGNLAMGHPGGVDIFSVVACYRNQVKLLPDEPLGWNADLPCEKTDQFDMLGMFSCNQ